MRETKAFDLMYLPKLRSIKRPPVLVANRRP
jgi:hypothetical protein